MFFFYTICVQSFPEWIRVFRTFGEKLSFKGNCTLSSFEYDKDLMPTCLGRCGTVELAGGKFLSSMEVSQ